MLDDNTAAQFEIFNIDINERLDDTKNCIRHGEGWFTLEDEYDLQKWDPDYGDNDPTAEGYSALNGSTLMADAEDINGKLCDKYIG